MVEEGPHVADRSPGASMDLRGTPCPLNWVKTKLRLEQLAPGMLLEVVVDEGNPARNVPRSAQAEGHRIVETVSTEAGVRVVIEKR